MATHSLYVGTATGLAQYHLHEGVWQRTSTTFQGQKVPAITALDAAILLANVEGAALSSFDGGATWQPSSSTPPKPFELRVATKKGPQPLANPRLAGATAYARLALKEPMLLGAGAGGMMLFRSYDDGIHWEPAGMPEIVGRIISIVPAADRPNAAWAGSDQGELLRSDDAGQRWHVIARENASILCITAVDASL